MSTHWPSKVDLPGQYICIVSYSFKVTLSLRKTTHIFSARTRTPDMTDRLSGTCSPNHNPTLLLCLCNLPSCVCLGVTLPYSFEKCITLQFLAFQGYTFPYASPTPINLSYFLYYICSLSHPHVKASSPNISLNFEKK